MHEIDTSTGRAGVAFIGRTPWHGLGQELTPGAPLETWQVQAGLDWEARSAKAMYQGLMVDPTGVERSTTSIVPDRFVLFRSDTGDALSIVSDRYQPVQPREIIEFYRDLTEHYGFELETAGSLKGGTRIWALANTRHVTQLRGKDDIKGYLLLATSFDGSMSTQARFTSVRVVCNNTLQMAAQGKPEVMVPHSTAFDADKIKLDLQVGEAWEKFSAQANDLTTRIVDKSESMRFLLDAYMDVVGDEQISALDGEENGAKRVRKLFDRLGPILAGAPGAQLPSARGTAWGLVQAVTFDVDHRLPARNQENRLNGAWFGRGAAIKQRAWNHALRLVA